MSDNVKAVWAQSEPSEATGDDEKTPDVSKERLVVASKFPNRSGLDRKIAFLFDHRGTKFFRVNYFDPSNQNYITKSHFVEVRGDKAEEWPEPAPKPRGFDYENLN
jgi:hypothetical protein